MMLLTAILSAWLQYGSDGLPHARAVVTTSCPTATVDAHTFPMHVRAGSSADFNDVVCDVAIPATSKQVRIGERAIPAPPMKLDRIVVIGDTGCRIKFWDLQSCNDPIAWPFPSIAHTIASLHPDLIVHVGDYLYRETACPPFDTGCAGSPFGDIGQAWNADWFTPAAPMFASAPLLLARGNHEMCNRSGPGWFRYLDAHPQTQCTEFSQPYAVALPELHAVLFDSAAGDDQRVNDASTAAFRATFITAGALASHTGKTTWFITHRPPYLNINERSAMGDVMHRFSVVLSGHIHLFAAMNIVGQPPLLINGEGGDNLDTSLGPFLELALGNLHAEDTPFVESHFGFGLYTRTANGWSISLRNTGGNELARCTLTQSQVQCNKTS